jgi:hypothetical protein
MGVEKILLLLFIFGITYDGLNNIETKEFIINLNARYGFSSKVN